MRGLLSFTTDLSTKQARSHYWSEAQPAAICKLIFGLSIYIYLLINLKTCASIVVSTVADLLKHKISKVSITVCANIRWKYMLWHAARCTDNGHNIKNFNRHAWKFQYISNNFFYHTGHWTCGLTHIEKLCTSKSTEFGTKST